jgi:hypothetical protein
MLLQPASLNASQISATAAMPILFQLILTTLATLFIRTSTDNMSIFSEFGRLALNIKSGHHHIDGMVYEL